MTMLLQLLGFALLASTMHATPRPLRLRNGSRIGRFTRGGGAALLGLSMLAALMRRPLGLAILDWIGLATISAVFVAAILTVARKYS